MSASRQSDQDLAALAARLDGLDDLPVARHPDVLEEVHGELAARLARLSEQRGHADERAHSGPASAS